MIKSNIFSLHSAEKMPLCTALFPHFLCLHADHGHGLFAVFQPGKQAEAHLKKVREVLQKGFDKLRDAHKKDSEEERNKVYAQGLAVLNRQMEVERQAAMRVVHEVVVEEVEKWRKKNGVSLVIARSMVVAGDWSKADYTKTILTQVNRRKVKFADLPTVTIKEEGKSEGRKGRR